MVFWLTRVLLVPAQKEWLFSYYGSGNSVELSLGSDQSGMKMVVDGEPCPLSSVISTADFTASMRPVCLTWTSSNGQLAVYFNGVYWNLNCSASVGRSVPAGGIFQLGGTIILAVLLRLLGSKTLDYLCF